MACKSNTAMNRGMAGLTTKYNIHFNGEEAYKEGLMKMEQSFDDDYSRQIILHPVYKLVGEKEPVANADFDRAIEKCKKALQTKSITTKPTRKQKRSKEYKEWLNHGEWNPYIHHSWVLSGKAMFYKGDFEGAQSTFSYTARHFYWLPQTVAECHIWTARCHAVQGFYFDAEASLAQIKDVSVLNSQLKSEYALAQAEILLAKDGEKKEIIKQLLVAKDAWLTKEQKTRTQFLIAQLYEQERNLSEAYKAYGKVISSAKNYKTQFNARIAQTRVMPSADLAKIEKKLNSYRRQKRNNDYLDQIYYALGNVALQRKDTIKAVSYYESAIEKSTRNGMDKAIAALRLGEVTFAQADYVKAQKAYSVAMSLIQADYPNYEKIAHLSEVLDELQTHAETVHLQDSLLYLSTLPKDELDKIIDRLVKEQKKAEKDALENELLAQYTEKNAQNPDPLQDSPAQNIVGEKDNSWYFYNKQMVSAGKTEFQRIWGSRKPEDNWRRKNKTETYLAENVENEENQDANNAGNNAENNARNNADNNVAPQDSNEDVQISPLPSGEGEGGALSFLSQIPFSEEAKQQSNSLIEDGMFNMGNIINEKLENFPRAIQTFEDLEKRYPNSEHRLDFYYSIYLMYMRMGQPAKAEKYRQRLMDTFPQSAYAVAVSDPNYIQTLRHMEVAQDSMYIESYKHYLANEIEKVHENYEWVHSHWPLCKLMPKFLFLHALSYVQEGNVKAFGETLEQLTAVYPESDVSPLAGQMVKGIHEGRHVQLGETTKGMSRKNPFEYDEEDLANDSTLQLVTDTDIPHLLLVAYSPDSISQNDLLFEIAKFNFENYLIKDFDLEIIKAEEYSVLVISKFDDLDDLKEYHDRMNASKTLVLPEGIKMIDISEQNFRTICNSSGLTTKLIY